MESTLKLLLYDALFLAICVAILIPFAIRRKAAVAVLKRNFVGYFSNPTGYAFLCLFVWLSSILAFWPHDFFASNMANLDQLNTYLPLVMLIYIPAITMSIWSEERREGTDELLLTLPADDYDIVIGKYFAAAAIFTASLLFAQWSNFTVLAALSAGQVDTGLLFATYLGYWMVGLAMISLGMVASFLSSNLTISFMLGMLFNMPLAFASSADLIIPINSVARAISQAGIAQQFEDFGRGVISVSSVSYFLMVVAIGIYLSMVLIGRRHWMGGRDGESMFTHYLVRAGALVLLALGVTYFFSNHDRIRLDATEGKVSSLSAQTKKLLENLDPERPIKIEAFISGQVPELYIQTKYDLLSMLKEFGAASGQIDVQVHNNLETFGEEATRAEELYGIRPQQVITRTRGAMREEEIILAAAFTSGVDKVVIPFFEYGVPVEYELIRSIDTVGKDRRPKLGVIRTDANLNGGFSMAGGMPRQIPKQEIITELEKQYDVEDVDAASPIEIDKYDVMLVVQPSSLAPPAFKNLLDAIRAGQPIAIFEDPSPGPQFFPGVTPTGADKQAPGRGGMFGGGGGQPQPKGRIQELWDLLGIESEGRSSFSGNFEPHLVWQKHNPYPKLAIRGIPDEWIFASNTQPGVQDETGKDMALNDEEEIVSGLAEILFPVPGFIKPKKDSDMGFFPLVTTGTATGVIPWSEFRSIRDGRQLEMAQGEKTGRRYTLAARITPADADDDDEKSSDKKKKEPSQEGQEANADDAKRPINVVYVADIDLLSTIFMRVRARPEDFEEIDWRFENVTFALNMIDALSGEDQYISVRKRKPRHSTLVVIEQEAQEAYNQELIQRASFQRDYDKEVEAAKAQEQETVKKFQQLVDELNQKRLRGDTVDQAEIEARAQQLAMKQRDAERRRTVEEERLKRQLDTNLEKIRRDSDRQILQIQTRYKLLAVLLPPIPPALIGLIVWATRRMREREGIAKSRLR